MTACTSGTDDGTIDPDGEMVLTTVDFIRYDVIADQEGAEPVPSDDE